MVFQEHTKGLMGCIMFNPWSTINILFNEYNSKGSLKRAGPWLLAQSQTMEWKVWANNGFWMEGYPSANEILHATWEHAALRQHVCDAEHVDGSKFWLPVLVFLVSWVQGSWDMRFCYTCDKEVSSSWFLNPLVGNHFSMFLECIRNWVGAGEMAQWIELAMEAWCSASTYNLGTKTRTRNSITEDWGGDLRSVGSGVSLVNPDARDGKHLVRWEALPQNRIK